MFIKSTHEKNSSHQIWAQSEHFWPYPKICILAKIVKNAPNLLKFNVINSFCELILHNKYEKNRSIFDNSQNFTFYVQNFGSCQKCSDSAHILFMKSTHEKNSSHQIWAQSEHFWQCPKNETEDQIVKNAPILLKLNVMNSFCQLILHNKYEKNRSIFDNSQNFTFHVQNFGRCQKCSDCAHILFIKLTHEKNSSHQIWAQSEHFWPYSKICIQAKIVKNAPILLKLNVMNSFCTFILHKKYEKNRSIFDNVKNFTSYVPNFGRCQKCSDCAHILFIKSTHGKNSSHQIWEQLEHF